MKENEDLQVERLGSQLEGYHVGLCVTGGIAAIESPKIARQLRRYCAEVKVYTTHEALKFVGEDSLIWGSGKDVVKNLTGRAEHICLEDLVLVAPATLNTINKVFAGIADNVVTCLIASALGKKVPVYMAPTMHTSLYNNPFFQENLVRAEKYGVKIVEPRFGENKAKIPRTEKIVEEVMKYFGGLKMAKTEAAVLCCVRYNPSLEVLMTRRIFWNPAYKTPMLFPGEWVFPGGKYEEFDGNLERTAKREFREEMGYAGRFGELKKFYSGRTGSREKEFLVEAFQTSLLDEGKFLLSNEVSEYAWFKPLDAIELISSDEFANEQRREFDRLGIKETRGFPYLTLRILEEVKKHA